MPASADEFADLEARLLAKQQLQFDALQKRLLLGSASAPEEIDQPFAEYARNFYVTAALTVCLVASMVYLAFTAGLYAMPTALIEAAGGVNVMDNFNKSWGSVTWEEVVERNPEVIVIVNYGNVTAEQKREFMMSNPAFADLDAVKNDRFVTLEYVEATPGPRNIRAIKTLANAFWGQ